MLLYHRTDAAGDILAGGFRDGHGTYLTVNDYEGVWLSDVPLDVNEGAAGDVLLSVDVPEHLAAPFEWVEDGKPYREFLMPAKTVNRFGPPAVVDEDAVPEVAHDPDG